MQLPRPRSRRHGGGIARDVSANDDVDKFSLGEGAPDDSGIPTVYWRPGCPFCSMLFRGLDRAGIRYRKIDIWADPRAAEHLRSLAYGNETVPTVVVGTRCLVNPRVNQVKELLASRG